MTELGQIVRPDQHVASLAGSPMVVLRDFPWPFRGMLAICSDIDDETYEHFAALHRFLNTREMTPLGRGLGLDVADSFWFYAPPPRGGRHPKLEQMSFFAGLDWRKQSTLAHQILHYIRGGWIDTLHSYGNFSNIPPGHPDRFTRAHAEHALAVLREEALRVAVWSNHGDSHNIQNVEKDDDMPGDIPAHPAHHTDLLTRSGTRFIWSTEMSSDFRRDKAIALAELRDGQKIWKFFRQDIAYRDDAEELKARFGAIAQNTGKGPMAVVWHPALLHIQLSPEHLADLANTGGYAIVGQHLGYRGPSAPDGELLPPEAVAALHRVKALQDEGRVLVASTARLLEYAVAREGLRYETATDASGKTVIDITGIDDPVGDAGVPDIARLRGVTFEVTGGAGELRLRGQPIPVRELTERHVPGKHIIGIRWFDADHTDYSADPATTKVTGWLDRQKHLVPVGTNRAEWENAVEFSRFRYEWGVKRYQRLFQELGWSGMRHGLDGGSGPGHWAIAFALDHETATGIDTDETFVRIANGAAQAMGMAARVRHQLGNIEALDFPNASFDAVWSHGTMQYCNTEASISEISRVLEPGGQFYCGWLTTGFRLRAIYNQILAQDAAQLRSYVGDYIGTVLHRQGLPHTPWNRVPIVTAAELAGVCSAFGLRFIRQPELQDQVIDFAGMPLMADILCIRDRDAGEVRAELMDLPLASEEGRQRLHDLVRLGLGKLVYNVLRERDVALNDPDIRSLYALAAIRADCAREVTGLAEEGVNLKVCGLLNLDQRRFGDAAAAFAALPAHHRDRSFLLGVALLQSGALDEAVSEFENGIRENHRPVECGFGAILAQIDLADWPELRQRMAQVLRRMPAELGASPGEIELLVDRLPQLDS